MELKEKELMSIESQAMASIKLLQLVNGLAQELNSIDDCYCYGSCAGGCSGANSGA